MQQWEDVRIVAVNSYDACLNCGVKAVADEEDEESVRKHEVACIERVIAERSEAEDQHGCHGRAKRGATLLET